MSATWPYYDAMQPVQLNRLVGLFLGSGCITREVLGRAISKVWLGFEHQWDYARQLMGFVMQIHHAHWKLLGIRWECWPCNPDILPSWVDLLLPHEDNSSPARARREGRVMGYGVGFACAVVSGPAPRPPPRPSQNPSQNPAPTSVANPSMVERLMPAPAPPQLHSQQPRQGPSQ
ncbi:hypothetical protein PG994_014959 [Apiospora phragmitis]|uniref:Uncharacterized protein n=1 Tax=Apiospora phragmitis TaxID=2905665 RepID=A0ABR1SV42_9PEZI